MTTGMFVLATVLLAANAFADDDDTVRAKLAGAWLVDNEASTRTVWILQEKSDAIHITHSEGAKKLADFECNTLGRECEVTDSSRPMKVSVWFNGPRLVELETRGDEVVKRRFMVSGQGETMELEVIPIVPSGKAERRLFKRVKISDQQN